MSFPDVSDYYSREDWADGVMDYRSCSDPDNGTDEERQAAYGENWKAVYALVRQAVSLTQDEAEKIENGYQYCTFDGAHDEYADEGEWELYVAVMAAAPDAEIWEQRWERACDAAQEAMEFKYSQAEIFYEISDHFLDALLATMVGDSIPKQLHDQAMRPWTAHSQRH